MLAQFDSFYLFIYLFLHFLLNINFCTYSNNTTLDTFIALYNKVKIRIK